MLINSYKSGLTAFHSSYYFNGKLLSVIHSIYDIFIQFVMRFYEQKEEKTINSLQKADLYCSE